MSRLQVTLEELKQKGYTFSSLKQLRGGINSAVFQAKSNGAVKYALKLYTLPSINDSRNRCRTEKEFLHHLKACSASNTPKLLESNIKSGWCLMSWIDGQKPTNLQPTELQDIAKFIGLINEPSTVTTRSELKSASEACQSLPGLVKSIAERINKLESTTPSSETGQNAIRWITKTLEPDFQSISQRLLTTRASCRHWQDLHACRIASPSDVGIHNTLRNHKGLHFIDFEYAGIDDLSKLAADWILQPEYRLDQTQEAIFTEFLLKIMKERIGSSWHTRLTDIKPLIHVKWCLIMLNELQSNKLTEQQFQKTVSYFTKDRPVSSFNQ